MFLEKFLANRLNRSFTNDGIHFVDKNGNEYIVGNPKKTPPVKIKFKRSSTALKLLIRPELYFGECYMNGDILIENGELSDALKIVCSNIEINKNKIDKLFSKILSPIGIIFSKVNTISISKKNVAHHYDLSNDLYKKFLDKKMQYSCAYFDTDTDSLETAQNNKINHIINKLQINSSCNVLDIGSGWGGLSLEIAKRTGANVTGITLSERQYEYSNEKAQKDNMSNKVEYKLMDYRNINDKFDRIVSVGMFEHVGLSYYKTYFKSISKLLTNDGISLIHTIGSTRNPAPVSPWILKYIFPGGYIPSLSEVAPVIEKSELILSDLEVLRHHYAKTLEHWKDNFLAHKEHIIDEFDEKFIRMWEYYLSSCECAFLYRGAVVFQFLLSKNILTVPITRKYLYN